MTEAFNKIDVAYTCRSLKQVPACEYNPFEAVQTNIIGAKNVIDAAIDRGVKKVMAISTDKAVNPINLYGATKLCAEKMFVQANAYSGVGGTKFSVCLLRKCCWQPGQRHASVQEAARVWNCHSDRPSHDPILDYPQSRRQIRNAMHRRNARRRDIRAQDPQLQDHGSDGSDGTRMCRRLHRHRGRREAA